MAYNTKNIITDYGGKPIPQGFDTKGDAYKPQTVTDLGDGRYASDVRVRNPLKVVVEDVLITVAAGSSVRIDYVLDSVSMSYVDCSGYNNITVAVQESASTNHDFEMQRQPYSNTNRAFQLANTFASFTGQRGGWEQIQVVAPRERLYIKNLDTVSRSYYCSIYLTV